MNIKQKKTYSVHFPYRLKRMQSTRFLREPSIPIIGFLCPVFAIVHRINIKYTIFEN